MRNPESMTLKRKLHISAGEKKEKKDGNDRLTPELTLNRDFHFAATTRVIKQMEWRTMIAESNGNHASRNDLGLWGPFSSGNTTDGLKPVMMVYRNWAMHDDDLHKLS